MSDRDMKVVYGMVHWRRLLHNLRLSRFQEALGIVADDNPRLLPLAA